MLPNKTYKTKRRPEKEMIFGIRAVIEAIQAGKEMDKIMVRRDMTNELSRELYAVLEGRNTAIQKVPLEKLNQLTQKNHQGVIAFISPVQFESVENVVPMAYEQGKAPFLIVLDGVTDVRNFGAIARSAECAGADALVIPSRGGASVNADAVKTSAGALLNIPVCRENNLKNTLEFLKTCGIKIVGATEKATKNYTEVSFKEPVAIILGSEEDGISPENLRLCDEKIKIPVLGNIQSLNVSVAAGVIMYEVVRQRQ